MSETQAYAAKTKRWRRSNPDCDGWWIYREFGCNEERVLIVRGVPATDDEWEREVGRPPDEYLCENYWDGTDLGDMTKYGHWKFDAPLKATETP